MGTTMNIKIIPYDESYKQSVFDFTDGVFRELGKVFEPTGRHDFYNDISHLFKRFYCMLDDNNLIGTVGLKDIDGSTAELKSLYLASEFRGKGLGTLLLNKAISSAKGLGYSAIVLDSMSKYKSALHLYERAGFVRIDRFNDNPYADIFMRLKI